MLAGILAAATFLVHDVGYIFSRPFWTDESWVAISTRLPLHDLLRVSASTPVGWSLLLRLVPSQGDEMLRIVPLVFTALTVVAAYVLARALPWNGLLLSRTAASLAGAATLLSRSALLRDDLKQYSADAFIAVTIWWMVVRVEKAPTRQRLVALGSVVAVGFLFSAAAAFVGAAAFAVVILLLAVGRRWARTVLAAIVGAGCGVVLVVLFMVFYRPGIPPGLNQYWAAYYLPISQGWGANWQFLDQHTTQLATYLGMGPLWLVTVLVLAGLVTLIRLGRPMAALFVPVLLLEMVVLAALKQYPLFDLRTSHFLTMILAVTAAVGVVGVCSAVRTVTVLPLLGATAAVVLLVANPAVHSVLRGANIPPEDVRTPTAYVAAHRQPGDLILVNMHSNWAFAYYWPSGTPAIEPVTSNLQRFITVFPDQPGIFVATDRTEAAVNEVVDRVSAAAARAPGTRVWFVHQHYFAAESQLYTSALAEHHLRTTTVLAGSLDLLTLSAG